MNEKLIANFDKLGLTPDEPEKARKRRHEDILASLHSMPGRESMLKDGDYMMLADLTEATVCAMLETMTERVIMAKPSLGGLAAQDLLMALVSKYTAEALNAMQEPVLKNLMDKRALSIILEDIDREFGPAPETKTLSGQEALDFINAHGCDCVSCTEARQGIEAGTHDLIVVGDEYLGLKKKVTVQ